MPKTLPITLIAQDSPRLRAYLNAFTKTGTLPSRVITLHGRPPSEETLEEAKDCRYAENFFDLSLDPNAFYAEHDLPVRQTKAASINDAAIYKALLRDDNTYALFTGGGIVSRKILSLEKEMIHIHPGRLPEYRGSTCFYYSLLQEGTLNASAILLRERIDHGPIIGECSFEINCRVTEEMSSFMDHILDPYIRSELLQKVLVEFAKNGDVARRPQPQWDGQNYYVMHPVLRAATVNRVNGMYDASKPSGIFINP